MSRKQCYIGACACIGILVGLLIWAVCIRDWSWAALNAVLITSNLLNLTKSRDEA